MPFIVLGLVTGAVYGLAGVGLVLTYKTSGVFNFAHGAVATAAAYMFYVLYVQQGMNWVAAALITLVVAGLLLGFLFERFARALAGTPLVIRIVATVGAFLIVQSAVPIIFGTQTVRSVPQFLPTTSHRIAGVNVTTAQVIVFAFAVVVTVALSAMLRFTRTGVAMRAVVDDPDLLDVAGTSPTGTRRYAWIIGVVLASVSGILIAPQQADLSGVNLTMLVLQAFGAAAIGAFASLPMTFVGGLALGVGSALCTKYFTTGLLAGLAPTFSFFVLFLVLLFFPKRKLVRRSAVRPRPVSDWTAPWQVQVAGGLVLLVILLLVPSFAGIHLLAWTQALVATIAFLSLGLVVRTSGQVNLGQVAFLAIGACSLAHLTTDHGMPWGLAVLVSGLITVPIGALLAIPAIRLSGLYLALATFGFGLLLSFMFYTQDFMFGDLGSGLTAPRPKIGPLDFTSDRGYYYLVLVFTVAAAALVMGINRARLGRLLRALADSPTALATSGASTVVAQVVVFCIAAFIAGVAGALGASAQQVVSGDSYPPLLSLSYLALVMISLGKAPWYAITSGLAMMVVPSYLTGANTANWLSLLFGVGAVGLAFQGNSNQAMTQRIAGVLDPIFRRGGPKTVKLALADSDGYEPPRVAPTNLALEDLRVTFGGLVAVGGVTVEAPTGKITGLIGPNGAGKTTTFNACSGLNRPTGGTVRFAGGDISRQGVARRARGGIGRTFQQVELFDSLTVAQNVRLGLESKLAGANVLTQLVSSASDARRVAGSAAAAMQMCGIADLATRAVADLSTGQRRLVELARAIAGEPRLLLLDEPSSGLDKEETAAFGEILTRVVSERGLGILIVEHDMSLVMSTCDYVYVLDFGVLIFQGTPAEVQGSAEVRAAYLGDSSNETVAAAEKAQNIEPEAVS